MTSNTSWPRVAVVGAGAVGGYYGGRLAQAGAPVVLIGRVPHVEAIRRDGLAIETDAGVDRVRVDASTTIDAVRDADLVLVCVKTPDTVEAARMLAPHLSTRAAIVSLQNGVDNAQRLRSVLAHPVYAAVVYVGAYMAGPGHVRHTGRGDLVLGVPRDQRDDAATLERLPAVAATFEAAGIRCPVADDIEGALWTKLVINCAFNATSALGRSNYGRMSADPRIRALMEAAVREATAVAHASGVRLDAAALVAQTFRVADAMASQISSTAQDILRGKPTEIDALNGLVVERGDALGVPVPVNRTLHALTRLLEAAPPADVPRDRS